MKEMHMPEVPAGFEVMPTTGSFHELVGPIYCKKTAGEFTAGLLVQEKHRNKGPWLHGGMLATLIDTAFTWATRHFYDASIGIVTTNLSIDFVASANLGDWIEARVEVIRSGRQLTFLACYVWSGDKRIARANAQFQTVDRSKYPLLK